MKDKKDNNFDLNTLLVKKDIKKEKPLSEQNSEEAEIDINSELFFTEDAIESISSSIIPRFEKKTFGYYIEKRIDDRLLELAKKTKTKKSEVLEKILKKVFGFEEEKKV
ncbi:hypothetical protein DMC14_002590 [Metamycoplasma phocicerebrale]|uniref:Uncharacterized protein n=1 Tax=Metamycoplasma phocicerebrale TaxID=142649 RepID=A0A3Q9V5M5_9BACT|nr:hypothetical protein [Metamycoplasma phocicerebrale]AZZ65658.1 hypothetical protein DMC14_002590 [Metamycoplasma phocicerebrale]